MVRRDDGDWRPRLRPGVRIAAAPEGEFQARWDFDEVTFLSGTACERILPWLVPLLDGKKSVPQLTEAAAGRCSPRELEEVLVSLGEYGLLEAPAPGHPREHLWDALQAFSPDPGPALKRVEETCIVACGRSTLSRFLLRSLAAHGFPPGAACETAADLEENLFRKPHPAALFPAVVETDWQPQDLEAINEWSLKERRPWILLGAWNRRVLVGPIFLPGETACYECFRRRLDSHRRHLAAHQVLESLRRAECGPAGPEPVLPAIAELAAALASAEVFSFVSGLRRAHTLGRVLVYQPDEARLEAETLLRLPWCPVCSKARIAAIEP